MAEFYAIVQDQNGNDFVMPADLDLLPVRYSGAAVGGYDQAEIAVRGTAMALRALRGWLGYRVTICNRHGQTVWKGTAEDTQINRGMFQSGWSLKGMYNQIAVAYSTTVNGTTEDGVTAWATDTDSFVRYGAKQRRLTASEVSLSQANAYRDSQLTASKNPVRTRSFQSANNDVTGKLLCRGFWHTTNRQYYTQLSGLEENAGVGNAGQPLGQGISGTSIGFSNDGKIHDMQGRLNKFTAGHNVSVSGATNSGNNGSRLIQSVDNREAQSYTSTEIWLDPADDIMDNNDGFGFIQVSDNISLSGTTGGHDGYYRVKEAGSNHLVVAPATISFQDGGIPVTVARGNSIQTSVGGVNERPGAANVTLTVHGQKIAQSFSLAASLSWTVERILVRLQRIGAPSDNVTVQLCADSAGAPGTVIEQVSVAASAISTAMEWTAFGFGNTNTISYGTTYWIVISRSGANDAQNYYMVDVDESLAYPRGVLKLWTGAAWADRATNADLIFRVMGAWETTAQIRQIVADVCPFLAGVDIVSPSGVYSNQYRNGETLALDELEALLDSGTSNGRRLLAEVTPERILRIYEQPAAAESLLMASDGTLQTLTGGAWGPGKLPHGQWIGLLDEDDEAPFFCERAEVDCQSGHYSALEPEGAGDVFHMGIQRG